MLSSSIVLRISGIYASIYHFIYPNDLSRSPQSLYRFPNASRSNANPLHSSPSQHSSFSITKPRFEFRASQAFSVPRSQDDTFPKVPMKSLKYIDPIIDRIIGCKGYYSLWRQWSNSFSKISTSLNLSSNISKQFQPLCLLLAVGSFFFFISVYMQLASSAMHPSTFLCAIIIRCALFSVSWWYRRSNESFASRSSLRNAEISGNTLV